jgi:hypothetical protein
MPLTIADSHVSGVVLQMQEGAAVSGRVVFEGLAAAPPRATGGFSLSAADGRAMPCCPAAQVTAAGEFRTQGYAPGRYYANVTNVSGWYLKAVTAGGRDILRSPLVVENQPIDDVVVTFTQRESSLEGRVTTRNGVSDPDTAVLVFPTNYQAMAAGVNPRIVRLTRPASQTGAFSLPNVVPGEYLVAAVPDGDLPNWRDLDAIQKLAQFATRVTVAPGEKKVVNLTRGDLP